MLSSLRRSRSTRRTATVTISAPEASIAVAMVALSRYSPVPTMRRERNSRPPRVNGVSKSVSGVVRIAVIVAPSGGLVVPRRARDDASGKITASRLASADEVHQLDRIARGQPGLAEAGAAHDLTVELDHHRSGVESQRLEQVEQRRRLGHATRLAVDDNFHIGHASPSHGASSASAAAAGSAACQRAPMAATP